MNNDFMSKIKRFFKNKNTVTIVGVVIVLGLLYWGYSSQVKSSVKPITVPVAAKTIQPRTAITEELITTISVPSIAVPSNVITAKAAILGKYTNVNTIIPSGSMFYKEALIEKSELPDAVFAGIAADEIPYMFSVNLQTTYGNSIFPDSKIDIYMKAVNEEGKVIFGKLLSNIKVVAVKDNTGKDVFENSEETRTPAYLVFGVSEDIHALLRIANYLGSVELIPVPHGSSYVSTEGVKVTTEDLKTYILSQATVYYSAVDSSEEEEEETSDGSSSENSSTTSTTSGTTTPGLPGLGNN